MSGDLRSWLEDVEKHGEMKRMSGVHWDLEMSGFYEIIAKELAGPKPVILFEDIPGCPKGFRTVFGLFGSPRRVAKTLGLPENQADRMSLLRSWHQKTKEIKRIPPRFVKACTFMDHVETGEKVDLLKFPTPRFHELDGGRYFGTCHAVIQKDPDSGFVNLGTYRIMLVDRNRLALHVLSGQHGSVIMNKGYFSRGKKMPVVVALGLNPDLWYTAFTRLSWGESEYDYAGGLRDDPVEVIRGEVTGLPIPAHAEIVIEGECTPGVTVDEGPFGEWHGYYGNLGLSPVPEPVIEVKALYYRNDPIMTCQLPARPSLDTSTLPIALSNSSAIWRRLEANGLPGVKGVWCYSEVAGDGLFIVVSIEQMYPGHSREVGLAASQFPHQGRYTIVVEEDIDPSDIEQVIWAMTTRGQPHEAVQVLHHCRSNSADTTIPLQEKLKYKVPPKPLHNSRIVIDACRPLEWQKDWYPLASLSPELKETLLNKYGKDLSDILKKPAR